VDANKKKQYQEFKSFVNYIDILTYALAISGEKSFSGDPDKWHRAIYEVCKKYKNKIPELKQIYFTFRPPQPPQSEQVDRLIKVLNMSREISLPNPRYPKIDITADKKRLILARETERNKHYLREIEGIGKILKENVSASPAL
jgi:hypothetical protein